MYTSIGITISDIKDGINALNQQIFQTSASLQDSVIHSEYEFAEGEMEAAFAHVCRTVSEPLAELLVRKGQKPVPLVNPLVVQVVLAMYLVHFCSSKIDSWSLGTKETSGFFFSILSSDVDIRRSGQFVIFIVDSL